MDLLAKLIVTVILLLNKPDSVASRTLAFRPVSSMSVNIRTKPVDAPDMDYETIGESKRFSVQSQGLFPHSQLSYSQEPSQVKAKPGQAQTTKNDSRILPERDKILNYV